MSPRVQMRVHSLRHGSYPHLALVLARLHLVSHMTDQLDRLTVALADRYAIEREIGAGGMATVYLAEDLKHKRKVALKVLKPELSVILGGERFLNEIKVTANLQHPNILPLYDSGEADTLVYYVMPYVEGDTLRDKLDREKQLGVDEAVRIAEGVAAALQYAHEHDIVHRDIKPENILMQSGQPLVADFGIALAVSQAGGARLTETGLSLGTPHYMSPEQATGDRELDARSDIYSLGAMVYEMLTGDPPHVGSTAQAVVAHILTEEPQDLAARRHTVPPHVAATVHKALEKLPADRFASAGRFSAALTDPTLTATTLVRAAAEAAGAWRWNRLSRALAGAAALALIVAAWAVTRPGPQPQPVPLGRYSLKLASGQELMAVFGPRFALAPDGSRFVYQGPGQGTQTQLWIRERDQLDATPLRGTEAACCPSFSPDGQAVAFLTAQVELRVVSLVGGPPVMLLDSGMVEQTLYGGSLDWGTDGFLYVSTYEGLARVPAQGGDLELVATLDSARGERTHGWADVLPNGRGAIVTLLPQDLFDRSAYVIGVADFSTGGIRTLVQGVYARYAPTGHLAFVQDDGVLLAAPFDQARLELTGPPVPLLEGVQVKFAGAAEFALSDAGDMLYWAGTAAADRLVWVERDGSEAEFEPGWTGDFRTLALSPDGTQLAVSIGRSFAPEDIWVKHLSAGPPTKLTFEGSVNWRVSWAPDGQSVVFVSDRDGGSTVFTKRADGSGAAVQVHEEVRPVFEAIWSPDGQWLVYRTDNQAAGQGDILALRPGVDSVAVELVATPFEEVSPTISPDGRWLAYASDESGTREVYVRPFPNSQDAVWLISTEGGSEPLWSRSEPELFYRSGAGDLVAATVVAGPTFALGSQHVLFSAANYAPLQFNRAYDVSLDDTRFVMIRQETTTTGDLVLVQNWFEELRNRVGN